MSANKVKRPMGILLRTTVSDLENEIIEMKKEINMLKKGLFYANEEIRKLRCRNGRV